MAHRQHIESTQLLERCTWSYGTSYNSGSQASGGVAKGKKASGGRGQIGDVASKGDDRSERRRPYKTHFAGPARVSYQPGYCPNDPVTRGHRSKRQATPQLYMYSCGQSLRGSASINVCFHRCPNDHVSTHHDTCIPSNKSTTDRPVGPLLIEFCTLGVNLPHAVKNLPGNLAEAGGEELQQPRRKPAPTTIDCIPGKLIV
ncbi:hypothetical protein Bbelb_259390 [Branchiostoma belcheri]|nr:hypothetical protein Bbelb_259390 [Branchiostoma belcheri]